MTGASSKNVGKVRSWNFKDERKRAFTNSSGVLICSLGWKGGGGNSVLRNSYYKDECPAPQDDVTALHIAVYNKHSEVVRILAKKADPKVLNACDRVSCLKSVKVV